MVDDLSNGSIALLQRLGCAQSQCILDLRQTRSSRDVSGTYVLIHSLRDLIEAGLREPTSRRVAAGVVDENLILADVVRVDALDAEVVRETPVGGRKAETGHRDCPPVGGQTFSPGASS